MLVSSPAPPSGWSERERRRVWEITQGGSVQGSEIPRQVLIMKVGLDYKVHAKPLRRKSRKPDQVDIARYSKEQIDAAIDAAVQAFGLESLKHQQQEAIEEFVSGRDVFVAVPVGFGKSYCFALLPTVFDHLRQAKSLRLWCVCLHLLSW